MKDERSKKKCQKVNRCKCVSRWILTCAMFMHVESFWMKKKNIFSYPAKTRSQSIDTFNFCSFCFGSKCSVFFVMHDDIVFHSHQMNLYKIKFISVFCKMFLRSLLLDFLKIVFKIFLQSSFFCYRCALCI